MFHFQNQFWFNQLHTEFKRWDEEYFKKHKFLIPNRIRAKTTATYPTLLKQKS